MVQAKIYRRHLKDENTEREFSVLIDAGLTDLRRPLLYGGLLHFCFSMGTQNNNLDKSPEVLWSFSVVFFYKSNYKMIRKLF